MLDVRPDPCLLPKVESLTPEQLCLHILQHSTMPDLLQVALDTLRIHLDVWAAMNIIDETVDRLRGHMILHESVGVSTRHMATFVREVGALRQNSKDQDLVDDEQYIKVRVVNRLPNRIPFSQSLFVQEMSFEGHIAVVPEITELIRSPLLPNGLTTTIQSRYDTKTKWTDLLWESAFTAIQHLASSSNENDYEVVLRLAQVLDETGNELSLDLDSETKLWFQARGHRLLSNFDERMWSAVKILVTHLITGGVLSSLTVLEGLVFPTWASELDDSVAPLATPLRYTNSLAKRLLIIDASLPVTVQDKDTESLVETQRLHGQLGILYTRPSIIRLFKGIANLVVIEHRKGLPEEERLSSRALRYLVSRRPLFRILATRFLEDVRSIFSRSTSINAAGTVSEDGLLETFEMLIVPHSEDSECEVPFSASVETHKLLKQVPRFQHRPTVVTWTLMQFFPL